MTFSISAAYAHPGIGIVVDSLGNVFYTDLKQVWRMSPDGKIEVAVSGVHTHELYLDASDNLYGEHLWYEGDRTGKWGHYVWKRSPKGVVEKVIPATEGSSLTTVSSATNLATCTGQIAGREAVQVRGYTKARLTFAGARLPAFRQLRRGVFATCGGWRRHPRVQCT